QARVGGRRAPDAGDRPLLLPLDLLPRAERRAVRDRHDRPRLHDRRAARDARREALAAAGLRAPPRRGRAPAHAASQPAARAGLPGAGRPAAVAEPDGALVLFHGRGADEHDLLPLLDALDPERRLDGFCPRGPLSLPPGGAHWYAVPRVGYPDPATFAEGFAAAAGFLGSLPPGRVVLRGF